MNKILSIIILGFLSINITVAEEVLRLPIYVHIVEIDENIKQTQYEVDSNDKITSSSIETVPYKTLVTKARVVVMNVSKILLHINMNGKVPSRMFKKISTLRNNLKKLEHLSYELSLVKGSKVISSGMSDGNNGGRNKKKDDNDEED